MNNLLKGIGTTELIIIAVILLVLFGGKKLPDLGRGLGQSIKEFRKSVSGDGGSEKSKKK